MAYIHPLYSMPQIHICCGIQKILLFYGASIRVQHFGGISIALLVQSKFFSTRDFPLSCNLLTIQGETLFNTPDRKWWRKNLNSFNRDLPKERVVVIKGTEGMLSIVHKLQNPTISRASHPVAGRREFPGWLTLLCQI